MHGTFKQDYSRYDHIGPAYPDLGASVAKYRRKANKLGGLMLLPREERHAYADAIEKAILAKQRAALQRELPSHNVHCASGTNHNTGEAIHNAMRAKQRAKLYGALAQSHKMRTDEEVRYMYDEAMKAKRARQAKGA